MKQPELGKKIVELRKAKGLTQGELVEKCKLNVRTLQRIESGEVTPRSYTIKIIFTALDCDLYNSSETTQSESVGTGFASTWLEQLYIFLTDLFNLKTNPMKKLSILLFFLLLIVFLTFNLKVHSQSNNYNPLAGKWKLVRIIKGVPSLNDSTYQSVIIKMNNYTTRFLEFKSDLSFETRTIQKDIYNEGAYSVLNDSSFITVHFESNKTLATVPNLYKFKIHKDTLHFTGFYMEKAPQFGKNFYEKKLVEEWWVKLKTL